MDLQFAHIMGHYHDEQVLLIRTAIGNRHLAWTFRPPSSGRGSGHGPAKEWEGREYDNMIEGVHKTLKNIATILPGYKGQGYEIAGFVWWQGHRDGLEKA